MFCLLATSLVTETEHPKKSNLGRQSFLSAHCFRGSVANSREGPAAEAALFSMARAHGLASSHTELRRRARLKLAVDTTFRGLGASACVCQLDSTALRLDGLPIQQCLGGPTIETHKLAGRHFKANQNTWYFLGLPNLSHLC